MQGKDELERRYHDQEVMLEVWYPGGLEELADLTGEPVNMVQGKIEHLIQSHPGWSKYVLLNMVLCYHRIQIQHL